MEPPNLTRRGNMNHRENSVRLALLVIALVLIAPNYLWGHDCSSSSDCQTVPANVARTTTALTALAAAALGRRLLLNGRGGGTVPPGDPLLDDWHLDEVPEDIRESASDGSDMPFEPLHFARPAAGFAQPVLS